MSAYLSIHAEHRMRKRFGLPRRATVRMADMALTAGTPRTDFSGRLRRYLDALFYEHGADTDMRIYSQHLFVFRGETLVTAWVLDAKFRKAATKVGRKEAA